MFRTGTGEKSVDKIRGWRMWEEQTMWREKSREAERVTFSYGDWFSTFSLPLRLLHCDLAQHARGSQAKPFSSSFILLALPIFFYMFSSALFSSLFVCLTHNFSISCHFIFCCVFVNHFTSFLFFSILFTPFETAIHSLFRISPSVILLLWSC